MKESFEKLAKMIKQHQKNISSYLPSLESSVDEQIRKQPADIRQIETLLDTLSSMMYSGAGEGLYIKLLTYYTTVNVENAEFYQKWYIDFKKEEG